MPHYALVIDDVAKAKQAMDEAMKDALRRAGRPRREIDRVDHRPNRGDLWTSADSECPLDFENCRNCGDLEYADRCKSEGHCPQCGTAHGIAPDSVLARKGLILVERKAGE